VVLQDDRFETIGAAVKEGRVVFDNVRKFVFYLFSCNLSEVLVILFASLGGLPMPLLPLQILWLNLVTDVFPALALAVEPPEGNVMTRPPRPPDAAILSRPFLVTVVLYGLGLTGATLGAFLFVLAGQEPTESATTVAFMTLALAQLLHVFNARSPGPILFSRQLFGNRWVWAAVALTVGLQLAALHVPPLARVLGTGPLSVEEWLVVGIAAAAPLLVAQVVKRTSPGSA
jgi:Ca2+-transporting ATPase